MRNDLLVRDSEVDKHEYGVLSWNRAVLRNAHVAHPADEQVRRTGDINSHPFKQPPVSLEQMHDGGHALPIENPPYIVQPLARRAALDELRTKPLLFKSPSDAYRQGFYETLFPNAAVTYVHLTRGFAQTVNGLMDGWTKNELGFISNPVGLAAQPLDIQGYSRSEITRSYWCFDLFPGWEQYRSQPLVEVCAQQWLQAHRHIVQTFAPASRISFESFYEDREAFCDQLQAVTGINLSDYDWSERVMSTEPPAPYRWKKRADIFQNLPTHLEVQTVEEVIEMQEYLGYYMEESTWR
jgi:hypothetical protein